MPAKLSEQQLDKYRQELEVLYIHQNLSIKQISLRLKIGQTTVYDRLIKCGIQTNRASKIKYNNQRSDITIPVLSKLLAEFIGIMLGDGHITPTQVTVTIGVKESYTKFIKELMRQLFDVTPKVIVVNEKYHVVYLGSTKLVRWLISMGLTTNKTKNQVNLPNWCLNQPQFYIPLLRGLIDTDGSIYKTKSGLQISFTNKSIPLLKSVKYMLEYLGYSPSKLSANKVYLTKQANIKRYIKQIGFNNPKHTNRYRQFTQHGRFV